MEMFLLYLLLVLPNLSIALAFGGIISSGVFSFLYMVALFEGYDEDKIPLRKGLKWSIVAVLVACLLPSEKAVAVLGAGYLVTKAVQVEGVEDIPANAVALLNQVMEEALKEKEGK